ncbi:MAG: hypothetical protein AAF802_30620 [Planctomycetota bacterium]
MNRALHLQGSLIRIGFGLATALLFSGSPVPAVAQSDADMSGVDDYSDEDLSSMNGGFTGPPPGTGGGPPAGLQMGGTQGFGGPQGLGGPEGLGGPQSLGGPNGTGANATGMTPRQLGMSRMSSWLRSPGVQTLFSNQASSPIESGPVLRNEAIIAYSMGNQELARDLLFGHIVAEYDEADDALNLVRYSRLMKRPAWGIRWGISFAVRGDATDPQPIDETSSGTAGGFGGFGDDMGEGMGIGEGAGMRGGPRMLGGMGMGMGMGGDQSGGMDGFDDGMMGMGDGAMEGMSMGGMRAGSRGNSGPIDASPAGRLAAMERPMLNQEADSELVRVVGLVATLLAEQFDVRFDRGDFGAGLNDITPESGNRDSVSESFVNLLDATESDSLWRPGIVYLGKGNSSETVKKARSKGLDLMFHLDILLKPRTDDFTQNICRVRLIHVPTEKSLGVSKTVDSLEFNQQNRLKGTEARDFVSEQLTNLWGIVDRDALTMTMPQLTPEVAVRRIGSLLSTGGGKNLQTLAEVRLFQSQGLLSEDQVLQAFDIVGGEEAIQLLYSSQDRKVQIVHDWATGSE